MAKVLFITRKGSNCGVSDYGLRLFNILKNHFDITLAEVQDQAQADEVYNRVAPDIVLYNYHYATLPFITNDFIVDKRAKHIAIFHEAHMNFTPNETVDTLIRPLFENFAVQITNRSSAPVIGSFGFGFPNKDFSRVARLVSKEFGTATLRLNIPFAEYGDKQGDLARARAEEVRAIVHPGITVEVSHDYKTHYDLLSWLHHNDLNLFLYMPSEGRGISSATDYALSVKKPIGVSSSEMFRHLPTCVCVDNFSLKELIERGVEPLKEVYEMHSNENLIKKYKDILK